MSEAWIGVVGGAIGALAGLCGAWLTVYLTARNQSKKEIREAVLNLIAKSRYPELTRKALARGTLDDDKLYVLVSEWTEDITRARARLAILAPAEIQSMGDFLWQKSDDYMNALLEKQSQTDIGALEVEVNQIVFELEAITGKALGHGREFLQRGLD
jgi:hypothetical protein